MLLFINCISLIPILIVGTLAKMTSAATKLLTKEFKQGKRRLAKDVCFVSATKYRQSDCMLFSDGDDKMCKNCRVSYPKIKNNKEKKEVMLTPYQKALTLASAHESLIRFYKKPENHVERKKKFAEDITFLNNFFDVTLMDYIVDNYKELEKLCEGNCWYHIRNTIFSSVGSLKIVVMSLMIAKHFRQYNWSEKDQHFIEWPTDIPEEFVKVIEKYWYVKPNARSDGQYTLLPTLCKIPLAEQVGYSGMGTMYVDLVSDSFLEIVSCKCSFGVDHFDSDFTELNFSKKLDITEYGSSLKVLAKIEEKIDSRGKVFFF